MNPYKENPKIRLVPGHFYRDRDGGIWCCVSEETDSVQRATCAFVRDHEHTRDMVECFHDGWWRKDGQDRAPWLVEECGPKGEPLPPLAPCFTCKNGSRGLPGNPPCPDCGRVPMSSTPVSSDDAKKFMEEMLKPCTPTFDSELERHRKAVESITGNCPPPSEMTLTPRESAKLVLAVQFLLALAHQPHEGGVVEIGGCSPEHEYDVGVCPHPRRCGPSYKGTLWCPKCDSSVRFLDGLWRKCETP